MACIPYDCQASLRELPVAEQPPPSESSPRISPWLFCVGGCSGPFNNTINNTTTSNSNNIAKVLLPERTATLFLPHTCPEPLWVPVDSGWLTQYGVNVFRYPWLGDVNIGFRRGFCTVLCWN